MKQFLFLLILLVSLKGNTQIISEHQVYKVPNRASNLSISILNYPKPVEIEYLKKLEIGVQLEETTLQKINAFLLKDRSMSSEPLNPFLEWEIDVEAQFYHAASNTFITIDGFYFKDFIRNIEANEWVENPTQYPFRIRFAPSEVGKWQCIVTLKERGQIVSNSSPFYFNVRGNNQKGYVRVHENSKNLALGDEIIYPIGHNFPAPEDGVAMYHNLVEPNLPPDETHKAAPLDSWMMYQNMIQNYAQQGGKYIRIIQAPWSSLIEFEERGNYYDRLNYAWEQDYLIDYCDNNDVYVLFNLMMQEPFMNFGDFYFYDWDWSNNNYEGKFEPSYKYPVYGYNDQPGIKQPHDMFLIEDDLKYHEQRIRYYIARYGYSTKIYGFELLSEPYHLSQYWNEAAGNEPFLNPTDSLHEITKKAIANYHNRISDYIKNTLHHDQHLIVVNTAQPGWSPFSSESIIDSSIFSPNVDVISLNPYNRAPNKLIISKPKKTSPLEVGEHENSYYSMVKDYQEMTNKPVLFSEGGQEESIHNCSDYMSHLIDLRTMCFTGAAGFNPWSGYREGQENIWTSTIMVEQEFNTLFNQFNTKDWLQGRQVEKLKGSDSKGVKEMQYYISTDSTLVFGYVRNLSYNYHTQREKEACNDSGFIDPSFETFQAIRYNDGNFWRKLGVEGLIKNETYKLQWYGYHVGNLIEENCIKGDRKLTVLEYPILDEENPILWFTLSRSDCDK